MQQVNQQQYVIDVFTEHDKTIMTWDENLEKWYPIAKRTLKFVSIVAMQISQAWYGTLFTAENEGLRMSVVQILSNNLTKVYPAQMGFEPDEWKDIIELNMKIVKRWKALSLPIEEQVKKRYVIMAANNLPMHKLSKA